MTIQLSDDEIVIVVQGLVNCFEFTPEDDFETLMGITHAEMKVVLDRLLASQGEEPWTLNLRNQTVTVEAVADITVDYQLNITTAAKTFIQLESDVTAMTPDGTFVEGLADNRWQAIEGQLEAARGLDIVELEWSPSGDLRIRFSDGSMLFAPHTDQYESWNITFPDTHRLIVSGVGGEIHEFPADVDRRPRPRRKHR